MYTNVVISIRTYDDEFNVFLIKIKLYQVLTLIIFILVMNKITKDISRDIPWCMLFTDDVMLVDERDRSRPETKIVEPHFEIKLFKT
jgi:hypothetical protein